MACVLSDVTLALLEATTWLALNVVPALLAFKHADEGTIIALCYTLIVCRINGGETACLSQVGVCI